MRIATLHRRFMGWPYPTICEEEQISFYDFSNVEWYGSNDTETIDGYHANETSYAKLTVAMSKNEV